MNSIRIIFIWTKRFKFMRELLLFGFCLICGFKMGWAQVKPPKIIHVFVALCDNDNQGIVPVPSKLGNGQNPQNNLYWGALYGVRAYFKNSENWTLISGNEVGSFPVLERIVFKHQYTDTYLIADGYDGAHIKTCITDFLEAAAGNSKDEISIESRKIEMYEDVDLVAYVGHDGLMEFDVKGDFKNSGFGSKDAIILACYSKSYFAPYLKATEAKPVVWTTGLMAPEAYTLEASLSTWIEGKTNSEIRESAAKAYHSYQKCGIKGAMNLLVTGY